MLCLVCVDSVDYCNYYVHHVYISEDRLNIKKYISIKHNWGFHFVQP